jgi:PleD family two-component response regulator
MTDGPKAKRQRRFALPEHDDQRAVDAIDALLGAPPAPDPDLHAAERGRGRAGARSAFGGLDSRVAFLEAMRREEERVRRYRRPASVAILSIVSTSANGTAERDVDRGTWSLIDATTTILRETDRVARVAPGRVHILLPETRARQAERVVDRIRHRWSERPHGPDEDDTLSLAVGVAPIQATGGAAEAFERAETAVTGGASQPQPKQT